jgi:hypothetical protein
MVVKKNTEHKDTNLVLIGAIVVVAVVGMFLIFFLKQQPQEITASTGNVFGEATNLGGQAYHSENQKVLPMNCLCGETIEGEPYFCTGLYSSLGFVDCSCCFGN